eukprot:2417901-Prymnesium_polylepis.1
MLSCAVLLADASLPAGCVPFDRRASHKLADGARFDWGKLCSLFGGLPACVDVCDALERTACFAAYLDALLPILPGGKTVGAWMLLQEARGLCHQVRESSTCSRLDDLAFQTAQREVLMAKLCDARCVWPHHLPRGAIAFVGAAAAEDKQ